MRRFQLQLIALLILVALLPIVPAVWTAHSLFQGVLRPVLSADTQLGVQAGLESTRELLQVRMRSMEGGIKAGAAFDTLTARRLDELDPRDQATLANLARGAQAGVALGPSGGGRKILVGPERLILGDQEVLVAQVADDRGEPVWLIDPIPEDLSRRAVILTEQFRLIEGLRMEQRAVLRGLLGTFAFVYLGILLAVLVVGLYLASRLTRPLALLGQGIERLGRGHLDTRVPLVAGGEVGRLLIRFNAMAERLERQKSQLVRLEKLAAWRQMARRMAHEIKNPLTPIQLAAQQVRDSYASGDEQFGQMLQEATSIIEEEVEALRNLVTEFHQFARLPEPQMHWVEASELLGNLAGLYGADRVRVRLPEELPEDLKIWCDREQVHRALINLVNNALQAQEEMGRGKGGPGGPLDASGSDTTGDGHRPDTGATGAPAGAAVEVALAADDVPGGSILLQVADRGPGVPDSVRHRIFEPDYTTKSDGIGLGLAIVQAIMESHGGWVAVEDRPGGGAIFTLAFPREPAGSDQSTEGVEP